MCARNMQILKQTLLQCSPSPTFILTKAGNQDLIGDDELLVYYRNNEQRKFNFCYPVIIISMRLNKIKTLNLSCIWPLHRIRVM